MWDEAIPIGRVGDQVLAPGVIERIVPAVPEFPRPCVVVRFGDVSIAFPAHKVTKCPDCQGTGIVYAETGCGGCSGYPGITHEPTCGVEPCPRGCDVPATATSQERQEEA
jgi:hypothetical protein